MEKPLKQRLVGALVLIALGVLFLPVLFDRDLRELDKTTQIPPAPDFTQWQVVSEPVEPEGAVAPDVDTMFVPVSGQQPVAELVSEAAEVVAESDSAAVETAGASGAASQPRTVPDAESVFDESPLPRGWLVQVASFLEQDKAEALRNRLESENFKAYTRSAITSKGEVTRVYIGPYIDRAAAVDIKSTIDAKLKVKALIVEFKP